MENQWINSMSYAALILIHRHFNNHEKENECLVELEKLGGWETVDISWIEAIERGLADSGST